MIEYIAAAVGLYLISPLIFRLISPSPAKCTSTATLKGKTAIVTGANAGLGKTSAEDLARRGARVFMACRSLKRAAEAREDILTRVPNADLVLIQLDLGSLKSVKQCADEFRGASDRLDILMNNAGFSSLDFKLSEEGIEQMFSCNHLGHFYLTRLLLPLLAASGSDNHKSRIINVSSLAHKMCPSTIDYEALETKKGGFLTRVGEYGTSKLANVLFTRHLAKLLAGRQVTTISLHPGRVKTNFNSTLISSFSFTQLLNPFGYIIMYPYLLTSLTPEQGAQTQIYAAVDESLEGVSGQYLDKCEISKPSAAGQNDAEAEKLWKWSCAKASLPEVI